MERVVLLVRVTCVVALLAVPVQAQEWSAEQLEVWQTISQQWEMEMADNDAWMAMLHPAFQGWPSDVPMPRDKADTERFDAAEAGQSKTVVQDIAPVGIVVAGDTAVAHYYYTTVTEDGDGERETTHGRYTDVLTRTADGWQFVAWSGGETPEDD